MEHNRPSHTRYRSAQLALEMRSDASSPVIGKLAKANIGNAVSMTRILYFTCDNLGTGCSRKPDFELYKMADILRSEVLSKFINSSEMEHYNQTAHTSSVHGESTFDSAQPILSATIAASFPIFSQWMQLFVLGGIFEYLRGLSSIIWNWIVRQFMITADFEQHDEAYEWMMVWLKNQPRWNKARNVEVKTTRPGQIGATNLLPGEESTESDYKRRLKYIPSYYQNMFMTYKYTWMRIERTLYKPDAYSYEVEKLKISVLSWDHKLLDELLKEAKKLYKAETNENITIYVPTKQFGYECWSVAGSRAKRPWSSVILDPVIKETILSDVKDFLDSEKWYSERGIPWRRGYLLHGAPGSGKTSLIQAIAGELNLSVYIITLSKAGLDDAGLSQMMSLLPTRCLALIEEIDAVFLRSVNRDASEKSDHTSESKAEEHGNGCSVTLSGLLGAMDGIAAQEGRILFATTNKYHMLDAALIRPGRLDVHVEFKLADRNQAELLFRCFYPVTNGKPEMGMESRPLIELSDEKSSLEKMKEESLGDSSEIKTPSTYTQMSEKELDYLAKDFAAKIPEWEVSMASIQGHLMRFKKDPYEAIRCIEPWIAEERGRKDRRDSTLPHSSSDDTESSASTTTPSTDYVGNIFSALRGPVTVNLMPSFLT